MGQNYGSRSECADRNNTVCQKATIAFRQTTKANDFVLICVFVVQVVMYIKIHLFYYMRDDPKVLILW